jgi:hypothetical protein
MDDPTPNEGLRDRLAKSGEDALGKLAQDLLENPLVNGAISRAFEARERAAQAQEVAFGALNIPSAADIERLTRRVRSVSQRLEGIEDGVDRLDEHVIALSTTAALDQRLEAIEGTLSRLAEQLQDVQRGVAAAGAKPAAADTPAAAPAARQVAARKPAARNKTAARKTASRKPASRKPASRAKGSGASGS